MVELSLDDAVAAIAGDAIGYAYSPAAALWFRKNGGLLTTASGFLDLTAVYHLQAFTVDESWTWTQTRTGVGQLVHNARTERDETREFRSLLWGKAVGGAPTGWTRLSEDRITPFDVPLEPTTVRGGQGVVLVHREVLARDAHGNTYVSGTYPYKLEAVALDGRA